MPESVNDKIRTAILLINNELRYYSGNYTRFNGWTWYEIWYLADRLDILDVKLHDIPINLHHIPIEDGAIWIGNVYRGEK